MGIADRAIPHGTVTRRKKTPPKRSKVFKPTHIPKGFVLVVDTREQKPLFTRPQKGLEVVRGTLHHGDYSFLGGEEIAGVERKYKEDFYRYIFDMKEKTPRKLKAMRHLCFRGLTIECSEDELNDVAKSHSKYITIEMIRGFLRDVNVKHDVHVYANKSRSACERWILDRLTAVYGWVTLEGGKRVDWDRFREECEYCGGMGVRIAGANGEAEYAEEVDMSDSEDCPWCRGTGERLYAIDEIMTIIDERGGIDQ